MDPEWTIINLDKRMWVVSCEDGTTIKCPPSGRRLKFCHIGTMNSTWRGVRVAHRKTVLTGMPEWKPHVAYLMPIKYIHAFAEMRRKRDHPNDGFTHGWLTEIREEVVYFDDDSDDEIGIPAEKKDIIMCFDGLMQES